MFDRRSFLLGSTALAMWPAGATALPRGAAALRFRGLSAPIDILDDVHGVPHIRAATVADAFFGQGYVVARDRLFQIDFGHRRELGRMAEAFGEKFADFDVQARLFCYHGDLAAELARVPADVLACARSYCAGVNARIDEVLADRTLMPLEYIILGVEPMRWDVHDLVIARGASGGDAADGIRRAKLAALGLLDLDALAAPLHPSTVLTVPKGLDVTTLSDLDLGILKLGSLPFGVETPTHELGEPPAQLEAANAGSNGWTIGPHRTATGRPILANDPHLGIGGFGPRHVAHLTAPGLDVIGGGAPGLPGIMQGHTDRFAFGRTNFHIDQEDLFVLDLDPADPERYRHDGGWKRFTRYDTTIAIKDAPPRTVTLRYSVQGPVVSWDPARHRATAIAAIGMQPGGFGAFSMIAINLARDWQGLKRAFALHPSPTNFHYADIAGNHGWQAIGFMPKRRRGDGLMPVPGDGAYDWDGYVDFRALPSDYNPAKGWFASANQNNLPPGWPKDRIPAYDFKAPYRYERIAAVLSANPRQTLADSVALQHDTLSTPARQFTALLPAQPSEGARQAAAMLAGWDCRLAGDSGTAALYEMVWRDLNRRVAAQMIPPQARSLIGDIDPSALLALLAHPDARFGADPASARDALIDASLAAGWQQASALLGANPAAWRWATLHQVRIMHPLSRIPAIAAAFPAIEGEGSGGDNYTVMARWLGSGPGWRVGGGASYLQVIDVGRWDDSLWLNLPGQSNDPRSPHYRDLYRPWIAGSMLPMAFSRAAVDAIVAERRTLRPA